MENRRKMGNLVILNPCCAVTYQNSIYYNQDNQRIYENIIKLLEKPLFDKYFIVYDKHQSTDVEINHFLPPHFTQLWQSVIDSRISDDIIRRNCINILQKNTLSAIKSEHNRKLITENCEVVWLCGFVVSIDIIATAFDLVNSGVKKIVYVPECSGEMYDEIKRSSENILTHIGVQIISTERILNDR